MSQKESSRKIPAGPGQLTVAIEFSLEFVELIAIEVDVQQEVRNSRVIRIQFSCLERGFLGLVEIPLLPLCASERNPCIG